MKSKTERLENTEFSSINNCCKKLYAIRNILEQCRHMNNEMLRIIASNIDELASDIQYNCLEYLGLEEGEWINDDIKGAK